MKWKQKLNEVGLTQETISHGLKNKIKDYYSILEGIDEAKQTIANPTINDDVEAIKEDLADLEEVLQDADTKLVKAIELYDKNKEKYAELSKHLSKGRPRKDGKPSEKQVATTTSTEPQVQKATQPQVVTPTQEVKDEPKKKSSGWGLFVGVLAIVTLGAGAMLFKNRD
jgi:uncharacterized protein with von Willebrand factor type A (vWA) domain